ncbi:hypothetical protein KDH83_03660 [Achromobacter sp. Marseille-Q0513]|uniref:hypothetical protein n=1 Tax=Achromobacter sp. Marseille-Q0513 TaxID=2829161 RepID=UPI001B8E40A0|nr:hypothetical protein [Achromobacter sp. Marseille-Q0513]MBR8652403.1 hypothetical protein [Achromobacter sp. Marseille-Q0513]
MLFLTASYLLIYANIAAVVRHVGGRLDRRSICLGVGHALAGAAALSGLLLGAEVIGPPAWGGLTPDTGNRAPLAYFVAGALSVLLLAASRRRQAAPEGERGRAARGTGRLWLAAIAGVYVCLAVVDHVNFFRDPTATRKVAPALVGEEQACVGDVLLVRLDADTAEYRCPTSVLLGRHYREVFAPWPGYDAGSSVALKRQLDPPAAGALR